MRFLHQPRGREAGSHHCEKRGAGRHGVDLDLGHDGGAERGRGGGRGGGQGHGGGHGQGRGQGGRRRVFDGAELRLVLLKLIGDQARHGYDLMRAIEELTGGAYTPSPGVVYPTLTLLQDMNHIQETKSEGARKAFTLTDEGAAHLTEKTEVVEGLFARLAEFAAMRERTDGGPIRRAMDNLRAALTQRFMRDDVDPEKRHQAAAILDEATQKIERL